VVVGCLADKWVSTVPGSNTTAGTVPKAFLYYEQAFMQSSITRIRDIGLSSARIKSSMLRASAAAI